MLFGVRERGQNVKTGSNQGVIIEYALTKLVVLFLLAGLDDQDVLLPLTPAHYRSIWWATLKRLALEWAGPPHNLRHTGAALFVASGGSLEAARRKGRWKTGSSVQRYTKSHWIIRHRARLAPDIIAQGQKFWKNPVVELLRALRTGSAGRTELGQGLIEVLARVRNPGAFRPATFRLQEASAATSSSRATSGERSSSQGTSDIEEEAATSVVDEPVAVEGIAGRRKGSRRKRQRG